VNELTNSELMTLSTQSHAIIEESILNVRTVQACNGQNFMITKLKKVNEEIKKLYNKSTFWAGFFDGLALFVIYFITGISLFFGCRLYFEGEIKKAGDVILIVNTICVTGYFLGLLGPHMSSLQRAASSFQLLYKTIESAPKSEGKEGESKGFFGERKYRIQKCPIQISLTKASEGRTTIIIAHRLSSLKNVDRIYVLDHGKTAEIGKHDELISLGGIYAKLAKSQEVEQSSKKDWEREELRRAAKMKKKSRNVEIIEPNSTILQEHEHNFVGSVIAENEEGTHKISFSGIGKLMNYLPKHPRMLTLVIVLSIPRAIELCSYGLGMSFAFNTLQVILKAQRGFRLRNWRTKNDYMTWNWITLGEQTLAGLTFWTLQASLMYLCGWLANEVMNEVKESILKEVLNKPIPYFDNPETSPSACVSRIISHAHNCYACLDHRAIRFVWFIAGTIFSLLLAFPFVWELGLLGLGITILLTIFSLHFVNSAHAAHSEKSKMDKSGEFAVEIVEHIRSIKLLAVEGYFETKFADYLKISECYENKRKNRQKKISQKKKIKKKKKNFSEKKISPQKINNSQIGLLSSFNFAITQSYVFACDMLLFFVGTLLIYHGRYTPDKIFLAFNGAQMSAWGVMYFSPWFPEIIRGSASANQLFTLFESGKKSEEENLKKPEIQGSVQVEDLTFAYPATPHRDVCKHFSLNIPKAHSIALVGASGCGKSTIIAMLERFYSPKSGKNCEFIGESIDHTDIAEIDVNHLRANIAVVGQEPVLFNASIRENITMGLENVTIEEVQQACKVANAANFIENFALGYDTPVGDGGGFLSGGQKQRIAIARAVIRKPKILLLDEATSALDTQSEEIVQKALRSATTGITSIIVAHRLSTVQHCDT
ncbi:hypothetical protein CAEBREN_30931, partial [Caenorhabditis brenneri]